MEFYRLLLLLVILDMTELYVADSESSSIRALVLKTGGSRLLAGGDPVFSDNLFKVICIKLVYYKHHMQQLMKDVKVNVLWYMIFFSYFCFLIMIL